MFITRVERSFEAAHKNGPAGGRCFTNHGHSWKVTIETSMKNDQLDEYQWSVDFSVLKTAVDKYDHQDLNEWFTNPSAESIATAIYNDISEKLGNNGNVTFVKIEEGHGNTLIYTGPDTDNSCDCSCNDNLESTDGGTD